MFLSLVFSETRLFINHPSFKSSSILKSFELDCKFFPLFAVFCGKYTIFKVSLTSNERLPSMLRDISLKHSNDLLCSIVIKPVASDFCLTTFENGNFDETRSAISSGTMSEI